MCPPSIDTSSGRGWRLFPPAYQRAMTLTDRLAGGIVVNSDYIRGILARNFDVPDERMLHVQERRRR